MNNLFCKRMPSPDDVQVWLASPEPFDGATEYAPVSAQAEQIAELTKALKDAAEVIDQIREEEWDMKKVSNPAIFFNNEWRGLRRITHDYRELVYKHTPEQKAQP